MITYQDFQAARTEDEKRNMIRRIVDEHRMTSVYNTARMADDYDRERNTTITNYVRTIIGNSGQKLVDITASNAKLCSNFFHRLNTQRCMYLLGNGLRFEREQTKTMLGDDFDTQIQDGAYRALIHGVSFLFWNVNKVEVFSVREFAPLFDEETNELRAGVRFWQIDTNKPMFYTLYEEDGFTKYRGNNESATIETVQEKRAYITSTYSSPAGGEVVLERRNYKALPIVPLYGSKLKQSTLVGMQQKIDSYDLIASGFANDLTDCSQIYWIVQNAGGMDEKELANFRRRLLFQHIANVDGDSGVDIKPYTQQIPHEAREAYLNRIRNQIYEDFGGFDCTSVSSVSKTATEINAAYQPLDEETDAFEYQIIIAVTKLLKLLGVTGDAAMPKFKRSRIANQLEETQMIMTAASELDRETILNHLSFLTVDEIKGILERAEKEKTDVLDMAVSN